MTVKERKSAYDREHVGLLKSLGRCVKCGTKLESDYRYITCPTCLAFKRAKNKMRYESRIAQGVCGLCGGVLENPTYHTCNTCRAKIIARQRNSVGGIINA